MSKRIIVVTVLSTFTVLSLLWFFWPSEEDRIREQFEDLSDLVSKPEDASPISDALALKNFPDLFCKEVVLETGSSKRLKGNYTNYELSNRYGRLRVLAKSLDLRFENLEFIFLKDDQAEVKVLVVASGTDNHGNGRGESFLAEVFLQKSEGKWRFARFTYLGSSA